MAIMLGAILSSFFNFKNLACQVVDEEVAVFDITRRCGWGSGRWKSGLSMTSRNSLRTNLALMMLLMGSLDRISLVISREIFANKSLLFTTDIFNRDKYAI